MLLAYKFTIPPYRSKNNDESTTYNEVLLDKDSEKWLQAMNSEMDSIYENEVWTLVDPPIGTKPIGCKWVFKRKIDWDEVKIEKVHTEENIADPLTKPLSQKKHDSHVFSYGLKNKHNWM